MRRARSFAAVFDLPSSTETPLDWRTIVTAQCFAMCSIASTTAVYAIGFFMARRFDEKASESELAFRAGALAAAKPMASALSAYPWGRLGDAWSFEGAIACTAVAHAMATLGFATAGDTAGAFAWRLAQGAVDGMAVLQKPALALVSDGTNAARAFATTGVAYGVASAFSPALAAALAEPCENWAVYKDDATKCPGFLKARPFFLANAWVSAMCLVPLAMWFVGWMEIDKHREVENGEVEEGVVAELALLSSDETTEKGSSEVGSVATVSKGESPWWRDANVRAAIVSQVGCTFVVLTGAEMTPVWMATSYDNGGLSFSSVEIGAFGSLMGVAILSFQVFLFTRLTRKYGIVSLLTKALLVNAVTFPLHPIAHLALKKSKEVAWMIIVVLGIARGMSGPIIMGGSSLILNNASPRKTLGAVNGFSGMFGNFGRGVAPLIGGALIAMMVSMGPNTFGRDFWPFIAIGIGFCSLTILSRRLSPDLNRPRDEKRRMRTDSRRDSASEGDLSEL
ncbi:Major facilitator superfamily domain, general substrate transporter [Ostreococcus tauri]|uniref:Major facilitator superfamily domain, general substrate transporter n=1 Tax=Ostreococcus tauri TaxID=70448 RepID=A0A090M5K7_OSTTA|nr:Major facilitator superfamily domain, general substrate transporter [Ostreococcus tauri]CEF99476.1 Major facilitator superfamily domain, general substrate transporter [Ostreococcus tauri]|eukprot:XP_022839855.1 Major facilitator superfamily domain, general substrate transporter [Ostreococcus tauri]